MDSGTTQRPNASSYLAMCAGIKNASHVQLLLFPNPVFLLSPFLLYLETCVTSASSLIKRYSVRLSLSFASSSKVLTTGRH